MDKKQTKKILKNTVSISELKRGFSKKDLQFIEDEKKYYRMIMAFKKARKAKKMTQEELAKKANLPRTTVTKVESGNRNATLQTLMALAGAMNKRLEIRLA